MAEIFEAGMIICFGISWPMNIIKSYKSKTAKGKSLLFLFFVFFGYISGIISKIIWGNITYVLAFYVINLLMVGFDIILYFINHKRDILNQIQY